MNPLADYCRLSQQLPNTLDALPLLAETVEAFGVQANWGDALVMQINLVLEELVVNAINYGYADARDGRIDLLLESNVEEICIHITDDGDAFNPFVAAAPDLSLAIGDRPIGGLGIYLVRSYMNACTYQYDGGHNQIVLNKLRSPQDAALT